MKKYVCLGVILLFILITQFLHAQEIHQSSDLYDKTIQFFSFKEKSVRVAITGIVLMGCGCGLMGGFVVTRKLSLFGDTLSHAVLPGVAVGFIWSQSKNSVGIIIGAMIAGFIGVFLISLIRKTTRIHLDSALGLVLSGLYAIGICLLTRIQKLDYGNQSGIDHYLFGQIAGLSSADTMIIGLSTILTALFILILYKEMLITGFDQAFASSIGLPIDLLQYILWTLLAFTVITSLQIVGIILVSALLIIPAATSSLITQRMGSLLICSALFGIIAGLSGCYLSFLGNHLPTGPLIVLSSTSIFLFVLFLNPKNGVLFEKLNFMKNKQKVLIENTLKAIYQELEKKDFTQDQISLNELAKRRRRSVAEVQKETDILVKKEYIHIFKKKSPKLPGESTICLTPSGWSEACRIVRNHRLWELYLTNQAQYAPDHVHEDAEKIEHILGNETVRQIEKILSHPRKDPHGKLIPSQFDTDRGYINLNSK